MAGRKPLTREQEIVQKLRKAAYITREARVESVKAGEKPYDHLTIEEFLEIIPGRRISWLSNIALLTPQPDRPLWAEHEAVVAITAKRISFDPETRILTFQDQEWSTRTLRVDNIFEITIRIIPERSVERAKTPVARRRQLTRRVAI